MYQPLIKPLCDDIKTFILDIFFPKTCLSCNSEGFFICPDCKMTMKNLDHQRCIVCQKQSPFGITHPKCLTSLSADQLISCYDYHDEKVSKIIIGGKYKFIKDVYKDLGQMIAAKLQQDYSYILQTNSYFLTPIPLHSSRKRWRGFNQAEILCQEISKELNLPIADVLKRNKITKTQKNLKKDQRLKNVSGVFAVSPPRTEGVDREARRGGWSRYDEITIKTTNFILVDDVTTTGATLAEAAKTLKQNGATKVICLTVARD